MSCAVPADVTALVKPLVASGPAPITSVPPRGRLSAANAEIHGSRLPPAAASSEFPSNFLRVIGTFRGDPVPLRQAKRPTNQRSNVVADPASGLAGRLSACRRDS